MPSDTKLFPMRHCFNCGAQMGRYKDYTHLDACSLPECIRAEREAHAEERERAHEELDRDNGWS